MDRNQIQKLGKKFNVKRKNKKNPQETDSFNFNNSLVQVDNVNLNVVNTLLNQLKQKVFVSKYDIYNFDIQMDEFITMFPEKIRLGLAGEILKVFQVKSTREIVSLKRGELLSTIIDNKIKFYEALYIMQVNSQFKSYLLPQTILFRFAEALYKVACKIGYIKSDGIPSNFSPTQFINFMYVIMNKIIVDVGEIGTELSPVDSREFKGVKTNGSVEREKPLNQIVTPKPASPKPAETVIVGALPTPIKKVEIVEDVEEVKTEGVIKPKTKPPFMIKLKPAYTINQSRLNNLLTEFVAIEEEPRSATQLNITNGIRITWNQKIPELLDFNKGKYSIKLDVPNPNKVYAGLNFAFSDLRNMFNGHGNFSKVCSKFAPGTTFNDTKIIGYNYKDIEITYERYSIEVLENPAFRADYSIITECMVCGEKNTYKLQSFLNRIQANSIGCRSCVRSLNYKGLENIGEILNAMTKVNIPLDKVTVKNFTNFKIKESMVLECQCNCGRYIKDDDLLLLLTRDTNRVNCCEDCSPFSNDTYQLIFAVNNYDIWQGSEYRNLAKKLVNNSLHNMQVAMNKYKGVEGVEVVSTKDKAEELVKELEKPKGINMSQENTVKETKKLDVGNDAIVDNTLPTFKSEVGSHTMNIPPEQLKIDAISNKELREDFFKKFEVPQFGFRIFVYIPELKVYSGMLTGDGVFNPLVCSWDEQGKLVDENSTQNVKDFSFVRRNIVRITDNGLNSVLEALLKHPAKIIIPNGELEETDILEIKTKFAELVIAKLNKQNKQNK